MLRAGYEQIIFKSGIARMHSGIYRSLLRFTRLIAVAVLVATFAGLLSERGLPFELLCHFPVQYLLLALAAAVVLIGFRRWGWLSLTLIAVVANGIIVLPWYLDNDRQLAGAVAPITVLQSNLNSSNGDLGNLLSLVDAEKPDLLAVQELSTAGESRLQELSSDLPYAFTVPRDDNFGIGIYSKWPIVHRQLLPLGDMALPTIGARINLGGKQVNIIVAHPPPPLGGTLYRERNRYLQALATHVTGLEGPVIVVGDLNSSMWSDHYRPLEQRAGLHNARAGFGVLPTWPASFPALGIPLDHCLVSQHIAVLALRVGPDIGSDHLPLIARLGIAGAGADRTSGERDNSASR